MDGYTAAQVQAAEKPLLEAGVPLMQRASAALAETLLSLLAERHQAHGPALILVGAGNNGGDSLFAAANLASDGVEVAILPVMGRVHEDGMAAAVASGAKVLVAPGAPRAEVVAAAREMLPGVAVVVDGMLGTGSAGQAALRGTARAVVEAALETQAEGATFAVIAVDIPSGLDSDTGFAADEVVLPADTTVTFGVYKAGLLVEDGPSLAGNLVLADIGLFPQVEGVEPAVRV